MDTAFVTIRLKKGEGKSMVDSAADKVAKGGHLISLIHVGKSRGKNAYLRTGGIIMTPDCSSYV